MSGYLELGTIEPEMNIESVTKVTEFAESKFEEAEVSMKTTIAMNIAIDELVSNIIYYSGAKNMSVELGIEDDMAVMTFTDDGVEYDPTKKQDADVTKSANEREIGGLGILMVKKSMDVMEYKREEGKNILIIKKSK